MNDQQKLSQIAAKAIDCREHIIQALKGLDEIIELANKAGRDDVVRAALAAKRPVRQAAKAFNDSVDEAGGDAKHIDPILIEDTDKTALRAIEELRRLYVELDRKVNDINENIATWGFGPDRDDSGKPIPTKNSWADWVTGSVLETNEVLHNKEHGVLVRLTTLENLRTNIGTDDEFSMTTFVVCTIIGMVVGMVVGLICLAVGAGPTGPIGGIFIGAVGGATVGLWLGNRRPKTIKS